MDYKEIVFSKLPEIYRLQLELNDMLLDNWRVKLKKVNFEAAVLVEAGEALESANYKWWKAGKYDKENIVVELIDILHFKMSSLYYDVDKDRQKEFEDFVYGLQVQINEDEITLLTNLGRKQRLFDLAKCFKFYGVDFEDVYKNYLIKYTLNKFRKNNGYKEGTYIKIWNGKEDNVVAFEKANNLELNSLKTELYKTLEEEYKNVVKQQLNNETKKYRKDKNAKRNNKTIKKV